MEKKGGGDKTKEKRDSLLNEMISDPNIPETGEQATRALHSSEENECCFHACSEELSGSGICANCKGQLPRRRGKSHDPPTAPRCEINSIQPASTGTSFPAYVTSLCNCYFREKHADKDTLCALSVSIRWRIPRVGIVHGQQLGARGEAARDIEGARSGANTDRRRSTRTGRNVGVRDRWRCRLDRQRLVVRSIGDLRPAAALLVVLDFNQRPRR